MKEYTVRSTYHWWRMVIGLLLTVSGGGLCGWMLGPYIGSVAALVLGLLVGFIGPNIVELWRFDVVEVDRTPTAL